MASSANPGMITVLNINETGHWRHAPVHGRRIRTTDGRVDSGCIAE